MIVLFSILGTELTQLILSQNNFTKANFSDSNMKLYLIEDINTSMLNMEFNSIDLIAELHGNNHTITHTNSKPLFRQIKNNIFNVTFDGYISDLIFFINMNFVTVKKQTFNLVLNSNITHCVFYHELANSIRSSTISDIKLIQNSALAHIISGSIIQNVILSITIEPFNRSYLLFHQASDTSISSILIIGGVINLHPEIDSMSIINIGDNIYFNSSVINLDLVKINANQSMNLFHEFGTLAIHNTSFVINNITIQNVSTQSLIIGTVQDIQMNYSLVKIGFITATSQSQATQLSILFESNITSSPKAFLQNNIFLINNIDYQFQNNLFILSNNINNSEFVNNTFQINQINFENVSNDLNLLANHTENTKFNNTTFIQKLRQIYTNNVDNVVNQTVILSALFNNTINVNVTNFQYVSFQDYFSVPVTTGNLKINTFANQWQNGSLENVSITIFNKTVYLQQNETLTGQFQISGMSNVINNTNISNLFLDIKHFNLWRNNNSSQTNTSVQMAGMGATLLKTKITNVSVNVNFNNSDTAQVDQNDIAFTLFTIGKENSTNNINNVYGQVFNIQQNFYYGSFFLGNISQCYITPPNITRVPHEKCQNYTNNGSLLNGFASTMIDTQKLIYLKDILYFKSSMEAVDFKQYVQLSFPNYTLIYGRLGYDAGNKTIKVTCNSTQLKPFICLPSNYNSLSPGYCEAFKIGYDCNLNYCYFVHKVNSCAGYFSQFDGQSNHSLDDFGNTQEFNKSTCQGGVMIGSVCYCNIGYSGIACNFMSCLNYLKENDVCYTTIDQGVTVQALCNYTGQCICHNHSYYVQNQSYQSQKCAFGCPDLIHGICLSANNDAECYPGYTNAMYRPGVNGTNVKCIVDGCRNKSDYEACTLYNNSTESNPQLLLGPAQNFICYGGICIDQQQLVRCQDQCNGICMSYNFLLQCVSPCTAENNTAPCLDTACQNNCNGNGICNRHTIMPTEYQENLSAPFTIGTCTCYDRNMAGYCDTCVSGYHFYRNVCLPDTCGGFYDPNTCLLRGGAVAGTVFGIILLILLAIALAFIVIMLLKRQRRQNSLQNIQQSQHLETLHYQL